MKRTFTLIELVVVIVILGIIAAILFPIFAQSREHSKRPQCLSNAKQFGVGIMMYAQDYDQHLPPAEKWMTVTQPYTKNKALYVCPVVKKESPKTVASYAMDTRLSGKSLNKLKGLANQALAYDSTRTDWDAADPGQTFAPRHSEGKQGSLVFADGHAKQVSREQFAAASLAQVVDKQ
ncbi:MAG: prepilin-type N-terminal cleavage/methylation domain-containing protein [Armatimonadetes bacterium]|nr:prepilin-type N-terminal cleavage/methylation domain-containing protein [Armatimonadota bacterium]